MAFMRPTASYFTRAEAIEYVAESADDTTWTTAGWYGYLSASGYLDRTDYTGPFDTSDEAIKAVMEFYEVDENGDELPEEEN